MSISTIDDIVNGIANTKTHIPFSRSFTAVDTAGQFQSGWQATGFPDVGLAPPQFDSGGPYTCTSGTQGALNFSGATNQNWIAGISARATEAGTYYLADRLWSCNMGFAASTYTVTTPGSLPSRITDNGVGCEMFIEQFTTGGSSTGTWTINYLDESGTPRSSSVAVITTPLVGLLRYVPHAAGAHGVSQIVSVVKSATGTSGSFGITIVKRVAEVHINAADQGVTMDWAELGLPKLASDSCLFWYSLTTVTTAALLLGTIDLIDK